MDEAEGRKDSVRRVYGGLARAGNGCCTGSNPCCAGGATAEELSRRVGYSEADLGAAPSGANLGLGCGNPTALASLAEGERVLDLGSGAGFDAFLAAGRVGKSGRVVGVDFTPEMLERARENARRGGYENVEFLRGDIEALPVPDDSFDAILSNCVINLAPDKRKVFREAFRVLKPGGRLMISDLVLRRPLPESARRSVELYVSCVAGALLQEDYLQAIAEAGFADVRVLTESSFPVDGLPPEWEEVAAAVVSVTVRAVKPAASRGG